VTIAHDNDQPEQAEPIDVLLHQRLSVFSPLSIEVIDDSALHAGHAGARSGGGHYRLRIVSPCFSGKSTLARHRMIYAALGDLMRCRIHALSIESRAPEDAT
jgi:BolA family transcriptional regulator, general stress-responsive regulator